MRLLATFLLFASVLLITPVAVYAQAPTDIPQGDNQINYTQVGLAGLTFLLAGLWYSCAGFIKKFRRSLTDETVKLDPRRMGKSVIVGIITGIAAFIVTFVTGDVMRVSTPEEFGILFGIATGIVVSVDKTILGGAGKPAPKPKAITSNVEFKTSTQPVDVQTLEDMAPNQHVIVNTQTPEPIGETLPPLDVPVPPGKTEGTA